MSALAGELDTRSIRDAVRSPRRWLADPSSAGRRWRRRLRDSSIISCIGPTLAPDRVLVARRDGGGDWREVTYAQMLRTRATGGRGPVERVACPRTDRSSSCPATASNISRSRCAAIWAGIPYCPVSPAYSQVAGELAKLALRAGSADARVWSPRSIRRGSRAHWRASTGDVEIIGDAPVDGRAVLSRCESLERDSDDSATGGARVDRSRTRSCDSC